METRTEIATELLPVAHSEKFDVRLSEGDNHLLVYREDTSTCIVDVELSLEQASQIKEVSQL